MIGEIEQPYEKFELSDEQINRMNDYGDKMKFISKMRLNLVLIVNIILLLLLKNSVVFPYYMGYFIIINIYILYKVIKYNNDKKEGKIKHFHTYLDCDDEITGELSTHCEYGGYFAYGVFTKKINVYCTYTDDIDRYMLDKNLDEMMWNALKDKC